MLAAETFRNFSLNKFAISITKISVITRIGIITR